MLRSVTEKRQRYPNVRLSELYNISRNQGLTSHRLRVAKRRSREPIKGTVGLCEMKLIRPSSAQRADQESALGLALRLQGTSILTSRGQVREARVNCRYFGRSDMILIGKGIAPISQSGGPFRKDRSVSESQGQAESVGIGGERLACAGAA